MAEALLYIVIGLLTVNILFVGVYLIFVLREFHKTLSKINSTIDKFTKFTESIYEPITQTTNTLVGITEGVRTFYKLWENFHKKHGEER